MTTLLQIVNEEKLDYLYPDIRDHFAIIEQQVKDEFGLFLRITEGHRDFATQQALYDQGRKTPGKIRTNGKPGYSFHHYGLAFDICFRGEDPYLDQHPNKDLIWKRYGEIVKIHGFVWGGDFKTIRGDQPHAEKTYGLSILDCFEMYKEGGIRKIWSFIDQQNGNDTFNRWPMDLMEKEKDLD